MATATAPRTISFVFRTSATGELDVQAVVHPEFDAPLLAALGQVAATRQGGHVLPAAWLKRILFRLVRWLGTRGTRLRAWTRTWRGPWLVDLAPVGGPVLEPFAERNAALQAEAAYLTQLVIGQSV